MRQMRNPFQPAHWHAGDDDDERILPLINIVFLLLIFFMIAGSIQQAEPFAIQPPEADAPETTERLIVIHLGADGRLAVGAQETEAESLGTTLQNATGDVPERVQVKADAQVEAATLVSLMGSLREAGVQRIQLLTLERGH
ncbi:MAG: biopolymer transporter ExbD [Gammaproteobacteria bacterium]|nr:biopolymer transporter ExbD [Gammaproteobacteria bacterium]MDX5375753.1 biopolymer transporter ExbD [Gammaproteobacteria bacterium]